MVNRSAITTDPGNCSRHKLFNGVTLELRMLPFLIPGYCRVGLDKEAEPKAQQCSKVGPSMSLIFCQWFYSPALSHSLVT